MVMPADGVRTLVRRSVDRGHWLRAFRVVDTWLRGRGKSSTSVVLVTDERVAAGNALDFGVEGRAVPRAADPDRRNRVGWSGTLPNDLA